MGVLSDLGGMASDLGGSFADNFGSDLNAMLGNVEKAIIEVVDMRERKIVAKDAVIIEGAKGMGQIQDVSDSFSDDVMTNKGTVMDYAADMGLVGWENNEDVQSAVDISHIKNLERKRFKVQFNPSSLSLTGHSGGFVQKINYEGLGSSGGVSLTRGDTNISLSVTLLFDACDPADAFMSDKLSSSPTSIGTGVAKAVMSGTGKKNVNVQTRVEGFIATLRNPLTRVVTFSWGEFSYSGVLKSVNATYTMFNVTGEPVRANVALSIMCADEEVSPNSLSWWQEKYKKAFSGDPLLGGDGSESFVKTSQKVGNLLNF
ncbi:MAG: hypothetical protein K6F35_03190 [Lachnospiraceae bacterium]|nr:hypothetical protein [Lachnospiraceae bacterium]